MQHEARGIELYRGGHYEKAAVHLQRALDAGRDSDAVRIALGASLMAVRGEAVRAPCRPATERRGTESGSRISDIDDHIDAAAVRLARRARAALAPVHDARLSRLRAEAAARRASRQRRRESLQGERQRHEQARETAAASGRKGKAAVREATEAAAAALAEERRLEQEDAADREDRALPPSSPPAVASAAADAGGGQAQGGAGAGAEAEAESVWLCVRAFEAAGDAARALSACAVFLREHPRCRRGEALLRTPVLLQCRLRELERAAEEEESAAQGDEPSAPAPNDSELVQLALAYVERMLDDSGTIEQLNSSLLEEKCTLPPVSAETGDAAESAAALEPEIEAKEAEAEPEDDARTADRDADTGGAVASVATGPAQVETEAAPGAVSRAGVDPDEHKRERWEWNLTLLEVQMAFLHSFARDGSKAKVVNAIFDRMFARAKADALIQKGVGSVHAAVIAAQAAMASVAPLTEDLSAASELDVGAHAAPSTDYGGTVGASTSDAPDADSVQAAKAVAARLHWKKMTSQAWRANPMTWLQWASEYNELGETLLEEMALEECLRCFGIEWEAGEEPPRQNSWSVPTWSFVPHANIWMQLARARQRGGLSSYPDDDTGDGATSDTGRALARVVEADGVHEKQGGVGAPYVVGPVGEAPPTVSALYALERSYALAPYSKVVRGLLLTWAPTRWRGHVVSQDRASVVVQRMVRGWWGRRRARLRLSEVVRWAEAQRAVMVSNIVCRPLLRVYAARKWTAILAAEDSAAALVTAFARGIVGRARARTLKERARRVKIREMARDLAKDWFDPRLRGELARLHPTHYGRIFDTEKRAAALMERGWVRYHSRKLARERQKQIDEFAAENRSVAACTIQRAVRSRINRRLWLSTVVGASHRNAAARKIQAVGRGHVARREAAQVRAKVLQERKRRLARQLSSTRVQTWWRCWTAHRKFILVIGGVVGLQCQQRRRKAARVVQHRRQRNTVRIQAFFRMSHARHQLDGMLDGAERVPVRSTVQQLASKLVAEQLLSAKAPSVTAASPSSAASQQPRAVTVLTPADVAGGDLSAPHARRLLNTVALVSDGVNLRSAHVQQLTALLSRNRSVTTLVFANGGMGCEGLHALAQLLTVNYSLTTLVIGANGIGPDTPGCPAVASLAQVLRSQNMRLQQLVLEDNDLGDDACTELAHMVGDFFVARYSRLRAVTMSRVRMGDRAGVAFGMALRTNATITTLQLAGNHLRDGAAVSLAEALAQNTSLTDLDLCDNRVASAGAVALANMLLENCTLKRLLLGNNFAREDAWPAFRSALERNVVLVELELAGNLMPRTTIQEVEACFARRGLHGAPPLAAVQPPRKALNSCRTIKDLLQRQRQRPMERLVAWCKSDVDTSPTHFGQNQKKLKLKDVHDVRSRSRDPPQAALPATAEW